MFSIIIPTLNEERAIERTLKNLKTISSVSHEIIVADTNSKDHTREIAKKYADRVVVYDGKKKPNAGIIRNLGASVAKGDILLFQDADVILHNADHFVARLNAEFEKYPEVVGLTTATRIEPELATLMDRIMYWFINRTILIGNVLRIGSASGECMVIRRTAFDAVGGFDESLAIAEDNAIFQQLARKGRTRILMDITTLQPGRRPHAVGWPRLLAQWIANWFTMTFLHKSTAGEWKEIR